MQRPRNQNRDPSVLTQWTYVSRNIKHNKIKLASILYLVMWAGFLGPGCIGLWGCPNLWGRPIPCPTRCFGWPYLSGSPIWRLENLGGNDTTPLPPRKYPDGLCGAVRFFFGFCWFTIWRPNKGNSVHFRIRHFNSFKSLKFYKSYRTNKSMKQRNVIYILTN